MSNIKHQLIPNTYTVLNPEDCQKWFEWANDNGISVYAGYWIGETNLSYSVDGHLISSDYAATDMQIPADEFLLRLQNKWEGKALRVAIDRLKEQDYKALYEAEKAKYETLLQGVKEAKAEMDGVAKGLDFDSSEALSKLELERSDEYSYKANGVHIALEILTERTKIQP